MAKQRLMPKTVEINGRDERLQRLEVLQREFIGIAFRILGSGTPHTPLMMSVDCGASAVINACMRCLEQHKQPPPPAVKSAPRRGRKPKDTQDTAWAKNIEAVMQ